MITNEELGRRIRLARESAKLTQAELGKKWLDKSHAAISDIERGATRISATALSKLATLLDISMDFFYEENDSKSKGAAYFLRGGRSEDGTITSGSKAVNDFIKHLKSKKESNS